MTSFANPAQVAIYSRLTTETTLSVYDDVPDVPAGMPDESFPYVVVGEDLLTPWDTDDTIGQQVLLNIYCWSRYSGKKEVKGMMGQIYTALHRSAPALVSPGLRFVDCLFEFGQVLDMADGKTRQGILRFRLTMQQAS